MSSGGLLFGKGLIHKQSDSELVSANTQLLSVFIISTVSNYVPERICIIADAFLSIF